MVNPNSWHFKQLPIEERVLLRSEWQGPCVVYLGERSKDGYGRIKVPGHKHTSVHRFMWERMVGPIPEGMQLDHLCRNEACWWHDHLRVVPPRTNVLASQNPAARNARKLLCSRGHPLTGDNLRMNGKRRQCKTCRRMTDRLRYQRDMEAVQVDENKYV